MKVSVIITTYNRPLYLMKVIDGYLNQSRLPVEIVVADDGSTGETGSLINEIAQNAKVKILHIWQEDEGFRAAQIRNKAIANCSGDYLIICDDDAIPDCRLLEDHSRYAEDGYFIQGHRILLGPEVSKNFTFKDISFWKLLNSYFKGEANNILNSFRPPKPYIKISNNLEGIRSCNMSFFKNDFIAINGFNENFIGWGKEDTELVVRFYKYGLKRKDLRFRGCCYHLYHDPYSRTHLEKNIAFLEKAQRESHYFCTNGIDKYLLK